MFITGDTLANQGRSRMAIVVPIAPEVRAMRTMCLGFRAGWSGLSGGDVAACPEGAGAGSGGRRRSWCPATADPLVTIRPSGPPWTDSGGLIR